MSDSSQEPYTVEVQRRFLARVGSLRPDDVAVLQRGLGERLNQVRQGYITIARLTGGSQGWTYRARDDYFLVATSGLTFLLAATRRERSTLCSLAYTHW